MQAAIAARADGQCHDGLSVPRLLPCEAQCKAAQVQIEVSKDRPLRLMVPFHCLLCVYALLIADKRPSKVQSGCCVVHWP